MKRVKYVGDDVIVVPALSAQISPGDEIDVPDDVESAFFVPVKTKPPKEDSK